MWGWFDFYGKAYCGKNYYSEDIEILKNIKIDTFMAQYYRTHQEDFDNPQHNLKGKNRYAD